MSDQNNFHILWEDIKSLVWGNVITVISYCGAGSYCKMVMNKEESTSGNKEA